MKNVKVCLLALSVLAGGVLVASAAATNATPRTNWVLNANFALQSWANGQNRATRVDNRAVISMLSGLTVTNTSGTNTTLPTFSNRARLLVKRNLGDTNATDHFVVRDGPNNRNTVDSDVSQFFTETNVATATFTPANGNSETDRNLLSLIFTPSGTTSGFNVSGFSQVNKGRVAGATGLQTRTLNATVAGTPGATPGTNATTVLNGRFSENGGRLE